jgi:RNA methyltransferase, TrmH family
MPEMITSPRNEKLKLVRRLTERRGRDREGLFATEGEDLLAAGRAAGWEPTEALVAAGSDVAGTEIDPGLLADVSSLASGTRAIAVWALPEPSPVTSGPCVYLHGVADPGNVGTIIRTATALLGARVLLGEGCADPWGPKASRASMGALFAARPQRGGIDQTPRPRLALDAHGGEELDAVVRAISPRTICLGAERHGLDAETLEACDGVATIPVLPGAESLNVAATAAIALHRVCSAAGVSPAEAEADG